MVCKNFSVATFFARLGVERENQIMEAPMKTIFAALFMTMSLSAFAQTYELNSKTVRIDGPEAVVARTDRTPKKVEITMAIPMEKRVCEERDVRHVMMTSSIHCGNRVIYRRHMSRVCDRRGNCRPTYVNQRVLVPNTCMVAESYCARYGTAVVMKTDDMTIEFSKKLPKLAGSEKDLFRVVGTQKDFDSDEVVYTVEALETIAPVEVKRAGRIFGSSNDDFEVNLAD